MVKKLNYNRGQRFSFGLFKSIENFSEEFINAKVAAIVEVT